MSDPDTRTYFKVINKNRTTLAWFVFGDDLPHLSSLDCTETRHDCPRSVFDKVINEHPIPSLETKEITQLAETFLIVRFPIRNGGGVR